MSDEIANDLRMYGCAFALDGERVDPSRVSFNFASPAVKNPIETEEITQEMIIAGFECEAWDKLMDAVMERKGWPYSCRDSAECVTAIYRAMREAGMPLPAPPA